MTRKQAIEILDEVIPKVGPHEVGERARRRIAGLGVIDALDRAGAFPSEATEAEIDRVAREIIENDHRLTVDGLGMSKVATLALRLASACRAAGLVK